MNNLLLLKSIEEAEAKANKALLAVEGGGDDVHDVGMWLGGVDDVIDDMNRVDASNANKRIVDGRDEAIKNLSECLSWIRAIRLQAKEG